MIDCGCLCIFVKFEDAKISRIGYLVDERISV